MSVVLSSLMRGSAAAIGGVLLLMACAAPLQPAATPVPSPPPTPSGSPSPSLSPSPSPAPPGQRMETPLPVALEESAAAALGGRLYVIGGFDAAGNSLRTVWVFDGSAWSAGPSIPLGLDHTSAATLGDHVYLAGGHSFGRDSARFFRLDGSSWTELSPLRHPRGGHTLLAAEKRLYVIGGNAATANVAPIEVYDLFTRRWSDLPSLPAPRNHVAGFVISPRNQVAGFAVGFKVCAAGGRPPNTARVDCFDIDRSSWARLPDLPLPTSGAGATALDDGRVVILGGQDAQESKLINQFADLPDPTAWRPLEPMVAPRHGFELALFEGRAWACGGGSLPGLHPVSTCTSVL